MEDAEDKIHSKDGSTYKYMALYYIKQRFGAKSRNKADFIDYLLVKNIYKCKIISTVRGRTEVEVEKRYSKRRRTFRVSHRLMLSF